MRTGHEVYRSFAKIFLALSFQAATLAYADQQPVSHSGFDIEIEDNFVSESLSILLDNQDLTELAVITDKGIRMTPPQPLEAGKHSLTLSFISSEGYNIRQKIEMDTASGEVFYDGFTGMGITLRGKLYDRNELNKQDHEVDVRLGHQGNWRSGSWSGDIGADIWMFDRGTNIDPLQESRPEVINYYASARQQDDDNGILAEAGYIQLNQSQNTIHHLARRGVHANLKGKTTSLDIFTVNSQQQLGSTGGSGIGDGSDNTIVGIATGWDPVSSSDHSLGLRVIYSKGAEAGDSLGTLSSNTPSEGDVAALVIESQLTRLGLNIEAEFDRSSFDADTTDAIDAKDDDAYALRLQGNLDWISYRAAFEHIGTNYAVVANPLLQNDREFITLSAGFDRGEHGFLLKTQVENDNLDDEASRAQLNRTNVTAEYLFRKGRNFSTLISLQNNQLDSEDEPASSDIRDSDTGSVLGKINFVTGRWNNLFSFLLSDLDDNTVTDNDSEISSLTFSPSLFTNTLTFTPSYTKTETEFNSGQKTRQGIFSMHIRGKAMDDRLDYQLSGSFSDLKDNTTTDVKSTYVIARTNWSLGTISLMTEKLQHSIGLELEHFDTENNNTVTQEDSIVWLSYSIDFGIQH